MSDNYDEDDDENYDDVDIDKILAEEDDGLVKKNIHNPQNLWLTFLNRDEALSGRSSGMSSELLEETLVSILFSLFFSLQLSDFNIYVFIRRKVELPLREWLLKQKKIMMM